jgi:hypothetical protein
MDLAKKAGAAGLGLEDVTKLLGGNGLSAEDQAKIRTDLGIDALESKAFTPAPSTEKLFTDAFAAAGLSDIKKRREAIAAELKVKKDEKNKRMLAVNENPWLSEASRLTNVANTNNFFAGDIGNLQDEDLRLGELYTTGLNEVNNLVSRYSTDFANQQAINTAQLNYLLDKADKTISAREKEQASKVARYFPEFLSAKSKSTAPDTITTGDGSTFQWDKDKGQFVRLSGPKPTSSGDNLGDILKLLQIQDLQTKLGDGTDTQKSAAGYYERTGSSDAIISSLQDKVASYNPVSWAAQLKLPNNLKSTTVQQIEQAQRNFITAILRRESGAAISEGEFTAARAQYFPQPGDSKEVLAQKKQNRMSQINALESAAGPAAAAKPKANNDPLGIR